MNDEQFDNILEALKDFAGDSTVPRNVKTKIEGIISLLKGSDGDLSLKINKALSELDEISEDPNLQSYTRTQIWNLASLLESI